MARTAFALALVLGLAGCERQRGASPPKERMSTPQLTIDVTTDGDGTDALAVHCKVTNAGTAAVHVFDSKRMPYVLVEDGTLVVLHGVHAPPADRDYNVIEIPTTRLLSAGETMTFDAALVRPTLHGHYEDEPAAPRHGAASVVCRVGYGATAITADDARSTTIDELLAWQQLASSAPVAVRFP